jgi:hypothetical protein
MPAIVTWLWGGLSIVLRYVAARVIFMLGIQAVTFVGLSSAFSSLRSSFVSAYSGLPATLIQVLGLFRVDEAMLVIFSAITARAALSAVQGSITKLVQGVPPTGQA